MKAMVALDRDDMNQLQYPVVVEMWKHIEQSGSKRRKFLDTFTESERAKIKFWYEKFWSWHLRSGLPESVVMSPATLLWLQTKVIPFFGQL